MSSRKAIEEVETFVLLPYADFKSMDQRVKRAEEEKTSQQAPASVEENVDADKFEATVSEKQTVPVKKKKDLSKSYRKTYLKKLIQQMPKTEDSNEILKFDKLDALIAFGPRQFKTHPALRRNVFPVCISKWAVAVYKKQVQD